MSRFRKIDVTQIVSTAERLLRRSRERFPEAGLNELLSELLETSEASHGAVAKASRPAWWLRVILVACLVGFTSFLLWVSRLVRSSDDIMNVTVLVQTIWACVELLAVFGGSVVVMFSAEGKLRRRPLIKILSELRSLAHIIDLHQMPLLPPDLRSSLPPTASSPVSGSSMEAALLARYLGYSVEALGLVGLLSAYCAQDVSDQKVLDLAEQTENLALGLSQKITNKIGMVDIND